MILIINTIKTLQCVSVNTDAVDHPRARLQLIYKRLVNKQLILDLQVEVKLQKTCSCVWEYVFLIVMITFLRE